MAGGDGAGGRRKRSFSQSRRLADRADPILALGPGGGRRAWPIPTSAVASCHRAHVGDCFPRAGAGWSLLLFLSLLAFATGYARHRQLLDPEFAEHHLRTVMSRDERIYLEGTLTREPEKLPNRSRWLVRGERIWHPTGAEEIEGDLLLSVRAARREWRYGDRVRFWVRPVTPRDSGNPGGFNYATYLARRGIYATGFLDSDAEVELVAREPGARIRVRRNLAPGYPPLHRAKSLPGFRRADQSAGGRRHGRHQQGNAHGVYLRRRQSCAVDLGFARRHARSGRLCDDSLQRRGEHLLAASLESSKDRDLRVVCRRGVLHRACRRHGADGALGDHDRRL